MSRELKFSFFGDVKDGTLSDSLWDEIRGSLKKFEGTRIELILKRKRRTRGLNQLGYYFAVIVSCFQQGAQEEWGEYLSKEEAHENLKKECNYKEIFIEGTGEVIKIVLSTSDFDTFQAEEYHERCRKLIFNYFNIVVPLPGEQTEIFLK